jgi:AraC family transcriptional regulator
MLRYFAYSIRNFRMVPDLSDHRLNWEVWVTFAGRVRPRFRSAPDRVISGANFWVMPPGIQYRWVAEDPEIERAVFHFAYIPHELEEIVQIRGYLARRLNGDELMAAREIAVAVDVAQQHRGRLSALLFQRAALDLAMIALRGEADAARSGLDSRAAECAENAVAWYRAHVRERPKFSRLADEMHISVSHLRRLFQQHYRTCPKMVLDKVRLGLAAHLMSSSRDTLEVIAREAGFHSSTDLCRVFTKHYGHSPNVWRRTVGIFDPQLVPKDSELREIDVQRMVANSPFGVGASPSAVSRSSILEPPAPGVAFADAQSFTRSESRQDRGSPARLALNPATFAQ